MIFPSRKRLLAEFGLCHGDTCGDGVTDVVGLAESKINFVALQNGSEAHPVN